MIEETYQAKDVALMLLADKHGFLPDTWHQFGTLMSVIKNMLRDAKTKPYRPEDFMPSTREPRRGGDR